MERPLKRTLPVAALGAALVLLFSGPALAADCTNKPTELDTAICGNRELLQLDQEMEKLIAGVPSHYTSNEGREYATMVADQLRWREDLWRQCAPLTVACLAAKLHARYDHLKPAINSLAGELYLRKGIKIGGLPLEMRPGPKGGLFLGDRQIATRIERVDVVERYTDDAVDALAFVADFGGNGANCAQYPLYIVAVRPGQAPDVVILPNVVGVTKGRQACIPRAARIADGFFFEYEARPWTDGKAFEWIAGSGDLQRGQTIRFKPRAGTLMRELLTAKDGTRRLDNEQFYEALRRGVTVLNLDFARAAEAFWFSWDPPSRRGDFFLLESCADPGKQGVCLGDFVGKAVYEQRTDKLYFAFSTAAAPPPCAPAKGRDPIDSALRGVLFFPPRFRWPDGALASLRDAYCRKLN